MMEVDITLWLKAFVCVSAALLTTVFFPWLQTKLDAEEARIFLRWVEIGVSAAEQLYDAYDGSNKKQYVINYLKKKGYKANTEEIDAAIEAAVLQLHAQLYKEFSNKENDNAEQP